MINDREAIKTYLDDAIKAWRNVKANPEDSNQRIAAYYIDAYQSVRQSIFDELLKT